MVTDNSDGTYDLAYTPLVAVRYVLSVTVGGHLALVNDTAGPAPVTVVHGHFYLSASTVAGAGLLAATSGQPATFTVTARDAFGNIRDGIAAAPYAILHWR